MPKEITAGFFTENEEVKKILGDIRNNGGSGSNNGQPGNTAGSGDGNQGPGGNKIYSDIVDQDGHQYVDLVQEGGGVLGIALAGFTHALEENGIRFMRLAGTSAGAINSMLLAAIGRKHQAKSKIMLEHLAGLNLLDLVDGRSIVRRTLSRIMKDAHYIRNTLLFFGGLLLIPLLALIINTIHHSHYLSLFIAVALVVNLVTILFVLYLLGLLKKNKYGLNPGNFFEKWISDILQKNGITDMKTLEKKAITDYALVASRGETKVYMNDKPEDVNLMLRKTETSRSGSDLVQPLKSDIILITSDITTQRKVELPRMVDLYWDRNKINPAAFVRASMSIPVFFEPKTATIPKSNPDTLAAWEKLKYKAIPDEVSFVDGGIISNFPISVFHNPAIRTPRLPVFGLRLKDSDGDDGSKKPYASLARLAGAIFSTVRFNYDKDFLQKYSFYDKYVSNIDVREFNWLNFSMPPQEQLKLFIKGVEAARDFLRDYNWETYKREREQLYDDLQK